MGVGTTGAITNGPVGIGTLTLTGGTLGFSANNLTIANAIHVTGTTTIGQNVNNAATLSGAITGNGTLQNKTATGSAPNLFFTGNLSGFTGNISYTGGSGSTTACWRFGATGGATIDLSNATVTLTAGGNNSCSLGFIDGIGTANTMKIGTLNGNGTFQGSWNGTVNNTLEVGAGTFSGGNSGRSDNTGSQKLSLTKVGSGTLTLSGTNINTGVTTISNGTLSVGSIGDGDVAGNLGKASNAATNIVFDGGTLQYTGNTATSNRAFTINAGKTAIIDVSTSGQSLSLAGATGTATTGALTKTGAGTLTLTGASTYSGGTTLNNGTLLLGVRTDGNVHQRPGRNRHAHSRGRHARIQRNRPEHRQ